MLDYRLRFFDMVAMLITLILTFIFNVAFMVPRIISLELILGSVGGGSGPTMLARYPLITTLLFELWGFIFAVLAGALAIMASRQAVRRAQISVVSFFVALILILYAILTVFLRGKLPAPFFPTYLDVSAGLPGWLIGYFWACGSEQRKNIGLFPIAAVGTATITVVTVVVLVPLYFPFYVSTPLGPLTATVPDTFHTVLPDDQTGMPHTANIQPSQVGALLSTPSAHGVEQLPPEPSASFDCNNATGTDERLICSSAELRQADNDLSATYQAALTASDDAMHQKDLRDDEREWVNQRNKNCGVSEGTDIYDHSTGDIAQGAYVDCLLVQYAGRIALLKRLAASPEIKPYGLALTEGSNSPFAWPPGPGFSYPPKPVELTPGTVMQIFHIESNGTRQDYTRFKRLTWLENNKLLIFATDWNLGGTDLFLWNGNKLERLASFPKDSGFMDECFLPNGNSYYGPDGSNDPQFGKVSADGVFAKLPSNPLYACTADPNRVWGDDALDPYRGPIQTHAGVYFYSGEGLFHITANGPQYITNAIFSDAKVSPNGCLIAGYVGGYHQNGMSVLIGTHRLNLQSGDVMILNTCAS